jgi:hypothetical protein
MEPVLPEDAGRVRDALAVIDTSVYLIRKFMSGNALADEYLTKHLSRIEESVRRAAVVLDEG